MTDSLPPSSNRPRRYLPVLAMVLAAAVWLAGCDSSEPAATPEPTAQAATAPAGTGQEPPARPDATPDKVAGTAGKTRTVVEVRTIEVRGFTVTGHYVGHLVPRERVQLRSEIDGVAEQVRFDEGQAVAKGQLLANISTGQLRVRRDQARADLKLAESIYQRERTLHEKKLVPDSQLEQTRTRLDLARLALELAEIELDKSQVRSPIAGTVKIRGVDPGEFMNKGQLIAEVLDVSRVRAVFNVPEREVRFIEMGEAVQVTFEALPGIQRMGDVRNIALEADLKTRTFPVEVELPNPARDLRAGMLARVNVALREFRDQILVPRYAVLEREQGPVVFVVRNGRAEERRLTLGATANGEVQVLDGLAAGDELVVTGHQRLTHGEPVEVRRKQS